MVGAGPAGSSGRHEARSRGPAGPVPGSPPMSDGTSNPVRYFGQQVRRARRAAGWTLAEFGQRIGYDPGQISRIENGKRPPTELFARMCDRAFPDRDGWFGEFYAESRTWIATPPWFRGWVEHEQRAATLRIWQPSVLSGLLQTEDYARAILAVNPAVTGQVFEDADIIAGLITQFDTLRNEAFRGSESLTLIERRCEEWTAPGAKAATPAPTAANA